MHRGRLSLSLVIPSQVEAIADDLYGIAGSWDVSRVEPDDFSQVVKRHAHDDSTWGPRTLVRDSSRPGVGGGLSPGRTNLLP